MNRIAWLLYALLTMITPAAMAADRPNILMVLTDDQGWGDLSVNGNRLLSTPNIDSLARDGATFERFYVCAVCSPTRAEMLTGRYHTRMGVTSTSAGGERPNHDETTIGDTFKAAGYATGCFGKWHSGMQWPYHPNARGFDEYYGFCSGHWGHYFSPTLEHNGKLVKGNGFIIDDLTERAMDFMKQNKDRPFFCYLPYNTPHSPMQVPEKFWKKFENMEITQRHRDAPKKGVEHNRAALAMCENIDWNVGRLLASLDQLGIAENTIVIYFSDNGPNGRRWNGGMKGTKGSTDEGGVRSPFFLRWPAAVKPGKNISQISGAIDLLPTLADVAGIPVISKKKLDGVSLKPLLFDTGKDWPERIYVNSWRGRVSIRSQQYRLDNTGQLFDMINDPGQRTNVAKQYPNIAKRLTKAAQEFRDQAITDVPARPFTVGHPDTQATHLPARDGISHGTIRRSNKFPNDSFFHNWTSTDDSITWDIEVLTAGRYRAQLYYTCRQEDVGATMQLSFGENTTECVVKEAHDPPLVGAAHDYFDRAESYVKDFKPINMGDIELPAKQGQLTLKAIEIPGKQAVDVRYIILTRVD